MKPKPRRTVALCFGVVNLINHRGRLKLIFRRSQPAITYFLRLIMVLGTANGKMEFYVNLERFVQLSLDNKNEFEVARENKRRRCCVSLIDGARE